MISWHNAPDYRHKGYAYVPDVAHEDEEGIRKAGHYVINAATGDKKTISGPSYRWLTEEEFTTRIDNMLGEET